MSDVEERKEQLYILCDELVDHEGDLYRFLDYEEWKKLIMAAECISKVADEMILLAREM